MNLVTIVEDLINRSRNNPEMLKPRVKSLIEGPRDVQNGINFSIYQTLKTLRMEFKREKLVEKPKRGHVQSLPIEL